MRSITWNLIVLSAVITVRAGTGFAAQSKPNVRVCVDIRQKDVNDTVPKKKKPVASDEKTDKKSPVPEGGKGTGVAGPSKAPSSGASESTIPALSESTDADAASPTDEEKSEKVKDILNQLGAPTPTQTRVTAKPRHPAQRPSLPVPPSEPAFEGWDQAIQQNEKSLVYIKRLFEYFVTHEPGYIAVEEGCDETIDVELYPLTAGWTAFARFSKTGREERVDHLYPDELSQFSERAVLSLIHDVSISETIARDTVLRSDSKKAKQKIRGNSHFIMAVGTQLRGGYLDTAVANGTERRLRIFAPMQLMLGYRGRFEAWGIEATSHIGFGTNKKAANRNPEGGHVDLGVNTGLSLHFLRYAKPRGLTSLYGGAGGTFELIWFSAVGPAPAEGGSGGDRRDYLLTGGLGVDLVGGVEFMRASAVQFFIQGELNLPAYVIDSANSNGEIHTWFPGASILLGVVF